MNIKKGDTVQIMTGKDAGKKGKVIRAIPENGKIVIEGANRAKRHSRPTRALPQGGILQIEQPLDVSNAMLVCSKCKKPTRVGKKVLENDQKVRVCKRCGEVLD